MKKESQHGALLIDKDLNGGVRFRVGGLSWAVSPGDAVKIADAILTTAGLKAVFANPGQRVLTPDAPNGHKIILPG